jgi:hypothetical protein
MDWPIDVSKLTFLFGKAEPVTDFKTKLPVADDDGVPLFRVVLAVVSEDGDIDRVTVKVPGEPRGLAPKMPVRPEGLRVSSWSMQDKDTGAFRSGEALKANAIAPVTAGNTKAAAA